MVRAPQCQASVYQIAANAAAGGDGSAAKPFGTLAAAIGAGGAGQIYEFQPGHYPPQRLLPAWSGTADWPTVIRSAQKYQAVIHGQDFHGIETVDGTEWITIEGFEVCGAWRDGVKTQGPNQSVTHCYIHHNAQNGVGSHGQNNNQFEGNLIEFNGSHPQFHHGIYADGDGLLLRANIVRKNAGYGLQLYPGLTRSRVFLNLVYGHVFHAGLTLWCPLGGGGNQVTANTLADNAGAFEVANGVGEQFRNNIFAPLPGTPLFTAYGAYTAGSSVIADRNLGTVADPLLGPGGRVGDPGFVAAALGAYWLAATSPARGLALAQFQPAGDFWGRAVPSPDAGCFDYAASLEAAAARAGWLSGYGYRFTPDVVGQDIPDFWQVPA